LAAPTVTLRHRTTYLFPQRTRLGPHTIRLRPAPFARADISAYALTIRPEPLTLHWFDDSLANRLARASFDGHTETLEIDVTLTAALTDTDPFDFVLEADAANWPFDYSATSARELEPYSAPFAVRPWLMQVLSKLELTPQSPVALLVALNQAVHASIRYVTRMEAGVQDPADTIAEASGSCRDVAWLLVVTARTLGFAARFVSGYLIQLVDEANPTPGLERDSGDLHAWAEVFLPGAGWIGFDATSGLTTTSSHIPLAAGAHPASAAPIDGTTNSATSRLETSLSVERDQRTGAQLVRPAATQS
jgi:transglutaminase-like putative cysteine protease